MNGRWWPGPLVVLVMGAPGASSGTPVSCDHPVGAHALPTAGNCIYDVVLHDGTSAYSAGTGIAHPVTLEMISTVQGGRQTLPLGGGRFLQPFARSLGLRSWDSRTDYRFDALGDVLLDDRGFACVPARELPVPLVTDIVRSDGQVIGLEAVSHVDHDGDELLVTLRIVAQGEGFEDSAVELTAIIENLAGTEARLGLRQAWNVGMVGGGAAAFGPVPPDPPVELWEAVEGEWAVPAFDHLLASWNNAPSLIEPFYIGGISVSGPWPLEPAPTPPDVIVRAADSAGAPASGRFGPFNTCFAWEVPDPPRGGPRLTPGGGSTEALVYYWGRTEDRAIRLPPGESRSFTIWFWAFLENPVTCDAGAARQIVECAGAMTPVELDGGGSFTEDGNELRHRWSSPDPAVTFDDPTAERPTAYAPGEGTYPITHDVGIGPYTRACGTEVQVRDTTPPAFRTMSVDPEILWPPNHRLVGVHVDLEVEDACDAAPEVRLVAVTSSEPDDATGLGDGHTTDDIQGARIGQDDRELLLRAERDGNGIGRIYTLTYEALDAAGNVATRSVVVRVPHDLRRGAGRLLPPRARPLRR